MRLDLAEVPAPVLQAVGRHLLDAVGVAVAARRHGLAAPAWKVAHRLGGPPEAAPLTGRTRLSAPAAALATGSLVHALDFDDTHDTGLVHASAVTVPAALAVGQATGATGRAVLGALVAGYEVVCRLGAASPFGFHERGLHATSVCGTLSSALVASRLEGLDPAGCTDALGIAGSASGGLLEFLDTGSDTKILHPGAASVNGILAARLAGAGGSGPATVLEGRRGLYAALSARPTDTGGLTSGLGERWECTRISLKPYPNCQLMHAALGSLEAALAGRRLEPSAVRSVVFELHPDSAPVVWGPAAGSTAPRTGYEAKFDLPWSAAALIVDGSVSADSYSAVSVRRPDVLAVARRCRLVVRPSERSPAASPGSTIIELGDSTVLTGSVDASAGSPTRPLGDPEVLDKFLANCGGHPAAAELAERLSGLGGEVSLEPVLALAALVASDHP